MYIISSNEWRLVEIDVEMKKFVFSHVKDSSNLLYSSTCKYVVKEVNRAVKLIYTRGVPTMSLTDRAMIRCLSENREIAEELSGIRAYFECTCSEKALSKLVLQRNFIKGPIDGETRMK